MSWNPLDWVSAASRWAGSIIGGAFSPHEEELQNLAFCPSCGFRQEPPIAAGTTCEACRAVGRTDSRSTTAAANTPPNCKTQFADSIGQGITAGETVDELPLEVLPRARTWLHEHIGDHSKDIYAMLNSIDGVRHLMQPFWDELSETERHALKCELWDQGFPGSQTFPMLVQWATARLRVRLTQQLRTAMWGPPIRVVRGGLPGLGK